MPDKMVSEICMANIRIIGPTIDVTNVFYIFYYFCKKRVFYVFIFRNVFYFLVATLIYPIKPAKILLNLLNSRTKRLSSDGSTMAAMKKSLMKSRSYQTLSCILRQYIYWEFFIRFD